MGKKKNKNRFFGGSREEETPSQTPQTEETPSEPSPAAAESTAEKYAAQSAENAEPVAAEAAPEAETPKVETPKVEDEKPAQVFPTLALCMIVRDEEEWITQAINSVKSIVSEIIVVDTGSKDNTVEIAQSLGAKVFHQPWQDDFSEPRNFSIAQATSDWILILDADEAIAAEDLPELQRLTLDRSVCSEFLQRHYTNDHRLSEFKPCSKEYPEWERDNAGYFESNCVRLFPNHEGIHYRGRVHELVEHSIRDIDKHKIERTKVRIQHFGHTDKVLAKKDKTRLYTPLGEQKLVDDPNYWQAYFEMGVEHNRNGRHWESVVAFLQSLVKMPDYVPTWVNMGYVLCEMGRYRQAEFALRSAIEIDQRADEAYCNLGVVYMRTGKLREAEKVFRAALAINPKYVNAACNLGKALAMMQRLPEAVQVYRAAIEQMPQCATAKADLGAILLSAQAYQQAENCLLSAMRDDPNMSRTYFHLGQLFRATGRVMDAANALQHFCRLEASRPLSNDEKKLVQQVFVQAERLRQQAQQQQPAA